MLQIRHGLDPHQPARERAPGGGLSGAARCARRRDLDGAERHDQPRACVRPREGGAFRISLTYDAPTATGKTSAHTDTYQGRFVKLSTNEQVVEVVEFETADPALRGEMTLTIALADADGGTQISAVHDGLPPGVPPADNEEGWRQSLAKLAALVEAGKAG